LTGSKGEVISYVGYPSSDEAFKALKHPQASSEGEIQRESEVDDGLKKRFHFRGDADTT